MDKFSTDIIACAKVNEQNSCELLSLKANRNGVSRKFFLQLAQTVSRSKKSTKISVEYFFRKTLKKLDQASRFALGLTGCLAWNRRQRKSRLRHQRDSQNFSIGEWL